MELERRRRRHVFNRNMNLATTTGMDWKQHLHLVLHVNDPILNY